MSTEWRIIRFRGDYCVTWPDPSVPSGRRRYKLNTNDYNEAARRAPARYAELSRPRGKTVADLWAAYIKDMEGRPVADTMEYTWRALKARFGELDADAISITDCREHTRERREEGIGDGTIHTELGHLRMVLLWAVKHKLIERAPAIERPPKPGPKDDYLTREEVAQMLDKAARPHVRLAILLLIGTGARSSAAMDLTWDRVDLERCMIQLKNPFIKRPHKGRALVPMNNGLRAALAEAKKGAMTPYVIEWGGKKLKSIRRGLRTAGTRIGRPEVSPHMLRHSAAVWLAEDGHSMEEIAQFLGHSDVNVTREIYARYSPTYLRKLAATLDMSRPPQQIAAAE